MAVCLFLTTTLSTFFLNSRIKSEINERVFRQVEKQVENEIKMFKQRPRISDKSKFLSKKGAQKGRENGRGEVTVDESVVQRLMEDAKRRQEKQRVDENYPIQQNTRDIEFCIEESDKKDKGEYTGY